MHSCLLVSDVSAFEEKFDVGVFYGHVIRQININQGVTIRSRFKLRNLVLFKHMFNSHVCIPVIRRVLSANRPEERGASVVPFGVSMRFLTKSACVLNVILSVAL